MDVITNNVMGNKRGSGSMKKFLQHLWLSEDVQFPREIGLYPSLLLSGANPDNCWRVNAMVVT